MDGKGPTGPSTTSDGRDPLDLFDEQVQAIRDMDPEELAAFTGAAADQTRADREAARERAAWRKEMRRREN